MYINAVEQNIVYMYVFKVQNTITIKVQKLYYKCNTLQDENANILVGDVGHVL